MNQWLITESPSAHGNRAPALAMALLELLPWRDAAPEATCEMLLLPCEMLLPWRDASHVEHAAPDDAA